MTTRRTLPGEVAVDRYEELARKRERTSLTAEEAEELGRLMADRRGATHTAEVTGSPTAAYRPLRSLGTAVMWMLGIAALLDLVASLSDLAEIELIDRVISGESVTREEASANDTRQAAFGLTQLAMFIATGVVFIVWLHRAYSNLLALGATRLRFARGWAIGGWFVPIWGTFRPKQIVNDAWRGSDPTLPRSYEDAWRGPVPPWWQVWWLSFLFSNSLGIAALRAGTHTLEELRLGSMLVFYSDLLSGVAGIAAVFIVRAITRRQEERVLATSVPPPPVAARDEESPAP